MRENFHGHLTEGTRDELVTHLRGLVAGWEHFGNRRLADEAGRALNDLLTGSASVRVGVTHFDVTED